MSSRQIFEVLPARCAPNRGIKPHSCRVLHFDDELIKSPMRRQKCSTRIRAGFGATVCSTSRWKDLKFAGLDIKAREALSCGCERLSETPPCPAYAIPNLLTVTRPSFATTGAYLSPPQDATAMACPALPAVCRTLPLFLCFHSRFQGQLDSLSQFVVQAAKLPFSRS